MASDQSRLRSDRPGAVPQSTDATSQLTTAVTRAGGSLTALDVVESHHDSMVVDVTCDATDSDHAERITDGAG